MNLKLTKEIKTFEGSTCFYEYDSALTKTLMKFSVFNPSSSADKNVDSAIIWLSGLTCNEENFITKAGAQRYLAGTRTMIICPDTSPRGLDLEGEHDSYDFGSGAGFYVNAKTNGYKDHYKMYDYISKEIVGILNDFFQVSNISIMGHSMGGHGALMLGLKEASLFKSVSAFSPIVNPTKCPWGQKAFQGYFGDQSVELNSRLSIDHDATELIKSGIVRQDTILIDQGSSDQFLEKELLTSNLIEASKSNGQELQVNYREGYDHSYYFISSFIEEHISFHLRALS